MTQPSLTARRVAERRAAHQLLDVPLVLNDPLALKIVGATRPEERARLTAREQGRLARTLRAFMAARSRLVEDELARRVREDGLHQYVILGAGLDTFAYRNPFGDRLCVFEVDQEEVQAWKRERLADAGIGSDGAVTYVPVDLESEDLVDALGVAGWDARRPTLFAWLGVTMYLEFDTVMHLLHEMARREPGTQVIFDYAISPALLGPIERLVFDEFAKRVAAAGEPWVSSFEPALLQRELRGMGFTRVEDLGPDDLNGRYFGDRADGMRVGTLAHIISATR
ncbi:MAG TPA: class I SAM-dependent methyltransferase [Vicinamibacterales bacterium]|nr:class I SAM-dependent methyltransferase [Vicinamibacterales bacterium]